MSPEPRTYGLAAEFDDPSELVAAARAARERGYRRVEAYSPYPIKELDEVLPMWNLLPAVVLGAGLLGAGTGFYMQFFIAAIVYPVNVGGRPLNSWPSFIPILFELTVLFASVAAFFGTLFFAGFPALYHPMFRIPKFRRASDDGFFLCIEARDTRFHPVQTARFLQSLDPVSVWEVDDE
jgi:Protein of unknown function (DUF3341)